MSAVDDSRWYAVHTHPREEDKALGHLRRQGYETYLPTYAKKIRHARRTERVRRPLFPRYLFVRLDLAREGWRPIRSTVGVTDMVCFGDQPAALPHNLIDALRQQEDGEGFIRFAGCHSLKAGDAVTILSGPFSRQLGLYEGITDAARVAILLDLLGRKVRVMLDVEEIEAAHLVRGSQ